MSERRLRISAASVPKSDEDADDNADRIAFAGCRIALSDGASRSARPEVWAELLVDSFARAGDDPLALDQIVRLRDRWQQLVSTANLPWHAVSKIAEGGAATFLGVEVDTRVARYRARAVGDTCLLHVRDGEIVVAGPIEQPDSFGQRPHLISTLPAANDYLEQIWEREQAFERGDALILATDAAAAFLLGASADMHQELIQTRVLDDADEFADWVAYARADGMSSDDTTICVVRL
ncbi:hypothetical protein H0264_35725 [Nocardia huaxiensis]|uniref:Serine/threonine protein phosphatase PrpC n=1 Tax=Nocardia huaxiensis TaxID=2755382 RepID=A0A7D6VA10_9NOCA|nr:hypothetical protein [Nocardia huaxiensis]QLY30414.1 hypothetical protein H0264_35725 [Nocardia huaxiensis]